MDLFHLRVERLSDHYGAIIGAALIIATVARLILSYVFSRPSLFSTISLLIAGLGLGLGLFLFVPAVPRVARALRQLAVVGPPAGLSGPFPVATFNVALADPVGAGQPIDIRIWYPSVSGSTSAGGAPLACAQLTGDHSLSQSAARFEILLYAPGNASGRDDNASTSANLASYGYVVAAIDDIERDPPSQADVSGKPSAAPLAFDFSSGEAFEETLRGAGRKVRLEAEKALAAIDRLQACASTDWREKLDFKRVGFFGFSMGGAVATEAGVMEKRIVAVANLDGPLFGRAASGSLKKPYMFMSSDKLILSSGGLQSSDATKRNLTAYAINQLRLQVMLASRFDAYWFLIKGSRHEDYSDGIFDHQYFVSWTALDPIRMKSIRDAYLLAFFDTYLRGMPRPLLRRTPSPYGEVELLKDSAHRFKAILGLRP